MNCSNLKGKSKGELPDNCKFILKELISKIEKLLQGKRELMYSDIINLIIRENYYGDIYNNLIIWCSYNIKNGKSVVKINPLR